jgi:tetratricopeptide (TPR) repeat protein
MAPRVLVLSALYVLLVAGCAEKKADPAKIDEATKLITGKQFEKGIAILDNLAKSSPNDEVLKKTLVDAHVQYGNYFMYESTFPPKEKYPSALRQYRIVAELDPKNVEAKQNISLIEGIYSQMGRTIPN